MKWVIGSLVALALAVIIWGAWYVNDVKTHRLSFGAGEAIAAEPVKTDSAEIKKLLKDRVAGNPDAPIEVLIFSSFSCYHCAVFHKEILPELKKRYADTGNIAIYYYDLAMDTRSATAGMLARCMDDKEFWAFADTVMANQSKWSIATDYKDILSGYATLGGMAKDKATECMNNKALLKAMLQKRDSLATKYDIKGTPTVFVVKDGKSEPVTTINKGVFIFAKIDELLGK
jgi:protein-disulfide isomerase